MKTEKDYLIDTVGLISDVVAENNNGFMFINNKADKTIYIAKHDARNKEREAKFIKSNVCTYGAEVYDVLMAKAVGSAKEYFAKAKEFFEVAEQKDLPASKIYETTHSIVANYNKNKKSENVETMVR